MCAGGRRSAVTVGRRNNFPVGSSGLNAYVKSTPVGRNSSPNWSRPAIASTPCSVNPRWDSPRRQSRRLARGVTSADGCNWKPNDLKLMVAGIFSMHTWHRSRHHPSDPRLQQPSSKRTWAAFISTPFLTPRAHWLPGLLKLRRAGKLASQPPSGGSISTRPALRSLGRAAVPLRSAIRRSFACKSSDAFRVHMQTGVAQCYSCGGKWSPFQLAEAVVRDRDQAKSLLVELGLFKPGPNDNGQALPADPIELIARQKGVAADSLQAFGAKIISPTTIHLPCYGPDGKPCTRFSVSTKTGTQANKGLFAKGKPAGLFFPHVDGQVRLPQPDEVWHLVEGVKDAAALHSLGLLACGLNTCRLAAKFTRLFSGVDVVLVPDRDRAGEEGSQFSARVLRGAAKSVRIAVLPAEFKESDGEDVRDVLRRAGGRDLVLQSIADPRGSASARGGTVCGV